MWNIVFLGLISFFMDVSTEMVYPLIPVYLTTVFGATPVLVGMIEGIAESLASLLKVWSGYLSDRFRKKKAIAFVGYSTGLVYKVALLLAGSWGGILAARVVDRFGKGIRTAPRDVMVSESAVPGKEGMSFGLHKALDMAGASLGILLAYFLISAAPTPTDYRNIFLWSAVPAVLALLMFVFVREKKHHEKRAPRAPISLAAFREGGRRIDGRLKLYLAVAFLFTLGNSSNAFLLLRAKNLGFDDRSVILLYFLYNTTAALLSIPAGRRSDKIGRKRVLVAGYLIFSIVYAGFAIVSHPAILVVLFILYGAYTALIAGVERAFIAEISPPDLKGTMLGMHSTLVGIALFPASAIAGLLWNQIGAYAPFTLGAILSLAAAGLLFFFLRGPGRHGEIVNEEPK